MTAAFASKSLCFILSPAAWRTESRAPSGVKIDYNTTTTTGVHGGESVESL
ncbi:hypothetical protein ZHAS_00015240 [Anopheles sinensis]|uniref:Uncharacterized protein n=1 Tax=Anopheles sinensis TaxID=74873 RepID=A0A084WAH2_ANOSI|nr:hypothetical protein ZHAS_00015240 [Anopheles sinensis]